MTVLPFTTQKKCTPLIQKIIARQQRSVTEALNSTHFFRQLACHAELLRPTYYSELRGYTF